MKLPTLCFLSSKISKLLISQHRIFSVVICWAAQNHNYLTTESHKIPKLYFLEQPKPTNVMSSWAAQIQIQLITE